MLFQNKYNRFPRQYEKPSGISKVEVAGYIPAKTKIESLIQAGARLIQSRKEQYDFPPGTHVTGDEPMDPTRHPKLDRTEIDAMRSALEDRLEQQIRAKKAREIEKDKLESLKDPLKKEAEKVVDKNDKVE